ncbi:MDR family MFS transporter [Winogradskyella immobilis]|uniref:MFS transporter n=1 Tax=Winogradskyella immobilis TaxID=2816852 RepID=A0ABS8EN88_9FLAO|nr:MFS transporter [Winogradskyella immobilis]MCC1484491.1 MFS transporter [Winogradskyella immobilis]MCG0016583.1 MFS transporter [Winogradskyella immobilis]
MKKLYSNYIESFKGLSTEIWYLSLISLINRAGTMVIPFLSLYLKKDLGYNEDDISWILACFGIGSVIGSWLGGKLTDVFGFYKVMVLSLFVTGLCFIGLQYIDTFWGLCLGILLTMSVADSFRPAIFVAVKAYSKPENTTRSIGLLRLAINAGMGIGPTLAGLIIVTKGYNILFWIDGITCITAIILFYFLVKEPLEKTLEKRKEYKKLNKNSAYKDVSFWIHSLICFLFGMAFFQLISALPLYYNEIFQLNEFKIGMLMLVNILIIVVFEMPLLNYLEKRAIPVTKFILISCALLCISYLVLYQNFWIGILFISMVLLTFSEMLGFPYTNKFVLSRAKEGLEGSYMAMYTISFSIAHIFSPKISLSLIYNYGYQVNWLFTAGYGLLGIILSYWLQNA